MFKLRPYQQHLVDENRRLWSEGVKNPCTVLPTGGGKCHRKGTKILMFDGTIKSVEDVIVGDQLMGPDSTPRNVLALGRGSEMMYEVAQVGADNYFVNESHILSMRYPHLGKVENVSVLEYLEITEIFGDVLHGWRVPNILQGDTSFVMTPITSVTPVGIEPYYGFEIDGDHLYLLGDFTVTHNTVVAAELIRQEQAAGGYFAAIAHRQELVGQISLALARQGVLHNIVAPRPVVKFCSNLHSEELGRSFYSPTAPGFVGGVNTVIRRDMSKIKDTVSLVFQDECHHVLADNLWGKAASLFPRANGLYVTATPLRADGKGLGRHADGIFDEFIFGPPMRQLIREGSLTDYRIYAPPSDIDLTAMKFGSDGDYSRPELVKRAKKSGIVGDVVSNYEKYCQGVQTVVFVVDVEQAHEVANKLNDCGVSAVALSANNTDSERQQAINAFKRKEIQVIVNVDLLGEGFDCPAIECVIMARPTMSYGLYCLSEDTEVLTPQGWIGISDAEKIEEVYGFDMQDSSISVQPVTGHVVRDKYDDEDMYGIKGPHLDILVSDKHDMVVKSKPRTGLMRKQKAEDVAQRKSMFNIPVSGVGEFKGADLSDSDLEFLGWFLSDGHLNKYNNAVAISQSVVKQRHCESIEKAIRGCGFKFGKHLAKRKDCPDTHNDLYVYSVSKGEPRGRDKHLTGWSRLEKWLDKSIPPCYDDLTVDQFEKLLRTFNLGDGLNNHGSLDYVKRTLTVTAGDNKTMADRLQHMCIVRGYRCNMAVQSTEGKKDLYLLHIRKSMFSSVAGRNDRDGSISGKKPYKRSRFEVKRYGGSKVWCLSNPLGTLITRRNGKVAIVGNCQQFGRGIRLLPGKQYGLIIDMVGNVKRHGLPDAPREWSLDRREKRSGGNSGDLTTKTCSDCLAVYAVGPSRCPFCGGNAPAPGTSGRGDLVVVDADLRELSPEELAELRGEADKLDREWTVPYGGSKTQMMAAISHNKTVKAQRELREAIALYAGAFRSMGCTDDMIHVQMVRTYGVNNARAMTLRPKDAEALRGRILTDLKELGVVV